MLLYLVMTIIRPQEYLPALAGVPLMPVVLVSAFALWLLSRDKPFWAPPLPLIVAFLVAIMLSMVASGWTGGAIDRLNLFGPEVVAFLVLASAATTARRITLLMAVFVLCATVLALHGVQQAQLGVGWTGTPLAQDGRIQYLGIFNDPNDLGLLFVSTFPMAEYLRRRSGLLLKPLWLACVALLCYGVYLTDSRGSLLAMVALVGAYIWKRHGVIAATLLGGAGLMALMALPSRLQELDVSESSALGRVDAWYEGLQMFLANPLLGVGTNNFVEYHYLTAHNSFILVLAETGFVGYLVWIAFVGYCFRMLLAALRPGAGPDPEQAAPEALAAWAVDRRLAAVLLLSLFGFFAAAFFLSRSYVLLLYLLAAAAVGHYVGMKRRYPALPDFSLARDWLLWPLLAAASIAFFFVLVRVLLVIA